MSRHSRGTQHDAFGSEYVDDDVGRERQHFLLFGELLAVRLHRCADDDERDFLERSDCPSGILERFI